MPIFDNVCYGFPRENVPTTCPLNQVAGFYSALGRPLVPGAHQREIEAQADRLGA
jgi:hypothetical protein